MLDEKHWENLTYSLHNLGLALANKVSLTGVSREMFIDEVVVTLGEAIKKRPTMTIGESVEQANKILKTYGRDMYNVREGQYE